MSEKSELDRSAVLAVDQCLFTVSSHNPLQVRDCVVLRGNC